MTKGIIYYIQPIEFIDTNIFKIGCSSHPDLSRCKNGYGKGTRYLCIQECEEPYLLEKKIKIKFNEKFKLYKGKEYFEGNEKDMYDEFIKLIDEHKKNHNKNINDNYKLEKKQKQKPNEKCLCGSDVKFKKCCGSNTKYLIDEKLDLCNSCGGSGISYWSDDIYGSCLECCCINCGKKNCTCIKCNNCDKMILYGDAHKCKLCIKCDRFIDCDYDSDNECNCNKCIICGKYARLRTNKHCDMCYDK